MNTNPETDLDLEKLFLPAWAQQSPELNRYANFTGDEGAGRRRDRDDRSGPRPPRREGGPRPGGPRPGPAGRRDDRPSGPGGPRREGGGERRPERGGPRRDERRGDRRESFERREAPLPLPEVNVAIMPDEKGVESLARQIKMTGRAFPLFDIAHLIIQKPERYTVRFATRKNAEGQVAQPLFLCALDDTLWLKEDEAVAHVLSRHFGTFYQAEKTAAEPPKGVYTFVAQCGMSGVILGPPNYHDYQNKLRKLHAERFARIPFEVFKARVKIVRDEAVVKQWIEELSWTTEYNCLNVPEPLKLGNREAVEQHFRATHKDTIIKPVETHVLSGVGCRALRGGLQRLVQDLLFEQRRFPMQVATALSQQFAPRGLQFFKVNKTVTHVAVARPHYLDFETTVISDSVRRIVDFINATPKCTRRKLMDALAPTSARVVPPPPTPPAPAPTPSPAAASPEGESASTTEPGEAAPPPAPVTEAAPQPAPPELTPEQTQIITDLHWLVHQGHVIEFANGTMETAKKPLPKPPKPEKKEPKPEVVQPATPAVPTESAASPGPAAEETATTATPTATVEEPAPTASNVTLGESAELSTPMPAIESESNPPTVAAAPVPSEPSTETPKPTENPTTPS